MKLSKVLITAFLVVMSTVLIAAPFEYSMIMNSAASAGSPDYGSLFLVMIGMVGLVISRRKFKS
ncbi:hypothetical protein [Teredinibacter sp. KSP-S5-2]|uniref:hypothetical protein n=1 Tax=Teredinibacter sp. KSP-S5-2 TaxID=3034506 RepID=UPI0029348117|nr:hypothetical protein [Teredinibacter sp. KSP-S5-2]WNO08579.1 hypothetical protein P5V12_16530 [Teredinibacter sp. KSP-S5-2]